MIVPTIPSSLANPIAPLEPVGSQPVGEENVSLKSTATKPVVELSATAALQLRVREKNYDEEAAEADAVTAEHIEATYRRPTGGERHPAGQNPERDAEAQRARDERQQLQAQISDLTARDREVRAHEQAHTAVGGQFASGPSFRYQRGPNGVSYVVGGEVQIEVGREATPQQTIQKMQVVKRAALAPAQPSPQDRRVAAQASRLEAEARRDLARENALTNAARRARQSEAREQIGGNGRATDQVDNAGSSPLAKRAAPAAVDPNAPHSIDYRLRQTVANTYLVSHRPGSLFDQTV